MPIRPGAAKSTRGLVGDDVLSRGPSSTARMPSFQMARRPPALVTVGGVGHILDQFIEQRRGGEVIGGGRGP